MIQTFTNFEDFRKKAQEIGVGVNLSELFQLDIVFLESFGDYIIISLKDYASENQEDSEGKLLVVSDNILILGNQNSLLYSRSKSFGDKDYALFKRTLLQQQDGESTVLAYLTLREALNSYVQAFNAIDQKIDDLEKNYVTEDGEETAVRLRKLTNRVEDYSNLLIALEERKIQQVNASSISYDYALLKSHAQHLLDRCRNHLNQLREVQREAELKLLKERERQFKELSALMRKFTAFVILLFVVFLLAVNFQLAAEYIKNAGITEQYPSFLTLELAVIAVLVFYFKRKNWI